jgi:RNA polymerase subunit RPABC4/transcription elongation factor Spt4
MKCHNCERIVTWTRTRCPACRVKMPAWYVIAVVAIVAGLVVAFKIVEAII